MSEKLTAKEYAEKLLYTPEYAADKQADVKEKAAAFALCSGTGANYQPGWTGHFPVDSRGKIQV